MGGEDLATAIRRNYSRVLKRFRQVWKYLEGHEWLRDCFLKIRQHVCMLWK